MRFLHVFLANFTFKTYKEAKQNKINKQGPPSSSFFSEMLSKTGLFLAQPIKRTHLIVYVSFILFSSHIYSQCHYKT